MIYLKLLLPNTNTVVGTEKINVPTYIKWQERNQITIICSEQEAQGISSADGSKEYQLADKEPMGVEVDLNAVFISEEEYEALSSGLDVPEKQPEPETPIQEIEVPSDDEEESNDDIQQEEQEPEEKIMTATEMRLAIAELQSDVENLKQSPSSPVNDVATIKFYETLSDSSTNSIAKIRAAAQQYLDDTSAAEENTEVTNA
jgi:flagellum-specific peptidoglycan hydrolase FlgJ